MKETIADMRKRFVFQNYTTPSNKVDQATHDKIYNQGWNDAMAHLKAAGRI